MMKIVLSKKSSIMRIPLLAFLLTLTSASINAQTSPIPNSKIRCDIAIRVYDAYYSTEDLNATLEVGNNPSRAVLIYRMANSNLSVRYRDLKDACGSQYNIDQTAEKMYKDGKRDSPVVEKELRLPVGLR